MSDGRADRRVRCAHCGLPVRGRSAARAPEAAPVFCCTGCSLASSFQAGSERKSSDHLLARIVLSAFLAMGVMVVSITLYGGFLSGGSVHEVESEAALALHGIYKLAALALSAPIVFLLGLPLAEAVLRTRRWLSVDAWIVVGASAAFGLSTWNTLVAQGPVYFETATMVLVLVGLGRWIDVRAKERARDELRLVASESASVITRVQDDEDVSATLQELEVGDLLRVRPGESLAVDGRVASGSAFLDTAQLTGESEPRVVDVGERVLAGYRVLDGSIVVRAEAVDGQRVCDEMERMLERAFTSGGAHVRRAEQIAALLLPVVLAIGVATAIWTWPSHGPQAAITRALAVLLIACPCALGIATPLAFWSALGRAWRRHVLVKGAEVLERLARVRHVAFDKTGTLTEGRLELERVELTSRARDLGFDEQQVLRLAATVELGSEHPIGLALRRAWRDRAPADGAPLRQAGAFRLLPGLGVEALVDGVRTAVRRKIEARSGRAGSIEEVAGAERPAAARRFGAVVLEREGEVLAELELSDRLRPEARAVIAALRSRDLELRMLSGDSWAPAARVAGDLGLPFEAELLPADKVQRIEALGCDSVLFVGDGMNDAAALATAGVGLAVDGGNPKSLDAADVVLTQPGLDALPELVDLARIALSTARFNLVWAIVYNAAGVGLAATGRLSPLFAAGAMVLSSLSVLANTSRSFARFDRASASQAVSGEPSAQRAAAVARCA